MAIFYSRYTAWSEGEPNNSGDGEDCAVLFDMVNGNQLDRFAHSLEYSSDIYSSDLIFI